MLRELVEKAEKLDKADRLSPVGYGVYKSEPIKYVIHIYPGKDPIQIQIEDYAGEKDKVRAKLANRSGGTIFPYPFADEMGYVLGIADKKEGAKDKKASRKHKAFLELLKEMKNSECFSDHLLKEAINAIEDKLRDESILKAMKGKELFNKTWTTFVYEKGWLKGKHLHELQETKCFWAEKIKTKICNGISQQCSICGQYKDIVTNSPLKITFNGADRQMVSLNDNSFISYRYRQKGASIGLCLTCADRSSQVMNHLIESNSRAIYIDKDVNGRVKNDSPRNQVAVYWLKEDMTISLDNQEYDPLNIVSVPLAHNKQVKVETTDELINKFLISPWTGSTSSLNLDENAFYLAVLSPNGPGRVAVRDWIHASSKTIKNNLLQYFEAMNLVDAYGQKRRPYVIQDLLEPLNDVDPNMGRILIRSAYLGEPPPFSLFQSAVRRLRISGARDGSMIEDTGQKNNKSLEPIEVWQRLCTVVKFCLTFRKEEAKKMESLDDNRDEVSYQAGILLAVLEEIQRRSATGKLSSTLVDRYYGSASTVPLTVMPSLVNMATKAHMPKIRKDNYVRYQELEDLLESAIKKIDEGGGFPRTMTLYQQGEFALGFYHQRAEFNSRRIKK